MMFYLTLTKEQEETRSYISIPASPNASEAQIIPADRANPNQKKLRFYEPSKYPAQITHVCCYNRLSLLKTYLDNIFFLFNQFMVLSFVVL